MGESCPRVYRPRCALSVLMTSVKIPQYRPLARLTTPYSGRASSASSHAACSMTLHLPTYFSPAPPLLPASQLALTPVVHLSGAAPSARLEDPFGPSPEAAKPLLGVAQLPARGEHILFREEQPLSGVEQPSAGGSLP